MELIKKWFFNFFQYIKASKVLKVIFKNKYLVIDSFKNMYEYSFYKVNDITFSFYELDEFMLCGFCVRQKINLTNLNIKEFHKLLEHLYKTDFSDVAAIIKSELNKDVAVYVAEIKYNRSIQEFEFLILVNNVNETTDLEIKKKRKK